MNEITRILTPNKSDQAQFLEVFGVPYSRFHTVTGFNLIAFDDWLEAGDEAVKEVIARRYGLNAVDLVIKIIHAEISSIS